MNNKRESVELLKDLNAFNIYLSLENGYLCFEITNGDYDRQWRINSEDTRRLSLALGLDDKTGQAWQIAVKNIFQTTEAKKTWYIKKFERLCEQYNLKYEFTS